MNASFLNPLKRTSCPQMVGLIIIVFASVFIAGCEGNSSNSKNKTDTVFVRPNTPGSEGMHENHEGEGNDRQDVDSTHHGMDSMNHKRHQ